jgi:hypothetical protein
MSTQPVTAGPPLLPLNAPLPNKVDGVFQATVKEPQNTDVTPLVGPPPDIETLLLKGAEQVKQVESLPVTLEEAAKSNCLQLIGQAQKVLEEAYQCTSSITSTQEKIERLKTLEALFERLSEAHLVWFPNKGYRPALQRWLDVPARYNRLEQYVASQGKDQFVKIFADLSCAFEPPYILDDR